MVALPCCHVTLSGSRSDKRVRPAVLNSLGDHIRERRSDLGLQKKQLARKFSVDETTIHNWEDKKVAPAIRFMPRIFDFLGYDPNDDTTPRSLPERLKAHRRKLGMSRKRFAELLGTDQSNLAGWETGSHNPTAKSLNLIERFLGNQSIATRAE